MEHRLTNKNLAKFRRLLADFGVDANKESQDERGSSYYRSGKRLTFGSDGAKAMHEMVKTLQTVAAWEEAYTADALWQRIVDALFESNDAEKIPEYVVSRLNSDCKALRAYVAFTGFHIDPDVELKIGPYTIRMLGHSGFEAEIIGRLQHDRCGKN